MMRLTRRKSPTWLVRINTVMQMAFSSDQILPGDSALAELQGAIAKSYSSKGQDCGTQLAGSGAARESVEEFRCNR
ncbi:hypothetical protein ACLK1T_28420 [Escherichia coli]